MKKLMMFTTLLTLGLLPAQSQLTLRKIEKKNNFVKYIFFHTKSKRNLKIVIEKGDITQKNTQAIVNAANEALWMPQLDGVAKAIIEKAGNKEIKNYVSTHFPCDAQGARCKTGTACTTPAFKLEKQGVKKIIHAVGPPCTNTRALNSQEEKLLQDAYELSLQQADANYLTSIAFPFMSSGIFACDKKETAIIALKTARDYLDEFVATTLEEIDFVLTSDEDFDLFTKQAQIIYT